VFWLRPRDLRLVACLGLSRTLALVLLGSWLEGYIDKCGRIFSVKVFLWVKNISIAGACMLVSSFFIKQDVQYNPILWGVFIIILATFSELATYGKKIAVTRIWVLAFSQYKDEMTQKSFMFQAVDLSCKIIAPIYIGLMIELTSCSTTAIVLAIWSIVSAVIENWLMTSIFRYYPKRPSIDGHRESSWRIKVLWAIESWKLYMTHPTRNAGLSLSFLSMTVLSFGNVLWAYSLLQGVPEWLLSILVGVSAINELLGNRAYLCMRYNFGVDSTGHVGLFFLLAALVPCVVAVFLPGSPWLPLNTKMEEDDKQHPHSLSIYVLLSGVLIECFGAWLSNIALTQVQYQDVEEDIQRAISSVQESLRSFFDIMKHALVLLLPGAGDFGYLVFISFLSVVCANILFAAYTLRKYYMPQKRSWCGSESTPLLLNFPYTPPSTIATPSPQTLANFII